MRISKIFLILFLFVSVQSYAQSSSEIFSQAKELRSGGKKVKSIKKFEEALNKAETERNIKMQMNCHIELAELKDNVINYKEALEHYKAFTKLYKKESSKKTEELIDSVDDLKSEVEEGTLLNEVNKEAMLVKELAMDSLANAHLAANLDIATLELDNKNHLLEIEHSENRRNLLISVIGLVVVIALFVGLGYARKRHTNKTLRNKNYQIVKEKQKSEELLLNILPKSIATQLKEHGKTRPSKFEKATVMFTDFKGFTKFSEKTSPEDLVALIDEYFCAFDAIIGKYNIEKIKTIGDAYLCVSGIPDKNPTQVEDMIQAALEMQDFVRAKFNDPGKTEDTSLRMRVGIHCGPLVAGVVGTTKFAYDVWGDTVNIAARMEQSGEPGCVNVSHAVYEQVKDDFSFEFRGEVKAKNKGMMKMYFATNLPTASKPES